MNKLEGLWREMVVATFRVVVRCLPGRTDERH
jgi:hypothetical protein